MEGKFNLEKQYQLYLKKSGLSEDTMHPVEQEERRNAFMAGCGQTIVLMRDDVGAIEDDDEAVQVMKGLLNQVTDYFLKVSNKQN